MEYSSELFPNGFTKIPILLLAEMVLDSIEEELYHRLSYLQCVGLTRYSPSYRPSIIDIGSVDFSEKFFLLKMT